MNPPNKICVYTALIGDYERLNEQDVAAQSGFRFICFTDNPTLTSRTWEIRQVKPLYAMDPIRSQRDIKLRPHAHLPDFDASLYIDNSVILSVPPEEIWTLLPQGAPLAQPRHSFRETVLDEFLEVARLGLDDTARIFEQLNHYLLACPEILEERPWWSAILLRDHRDPRIRTLGDTWMSHVARYARRDQLSGNIAMREAGITPVPIDIDNYTSHFHRWPITPDRDRDRDRGPRNPLANLTPLPARLRNLEHFLVEAKRQTDALE